MVEVSPIPFPLPIATIEMLHLSKILKSRHIHILTKNKNESLKSRVLNMSQLFIQKKKNIYESLKSEVEFWSELLFEFHKLLYFFSLFSWHWMDHNMYINVQTRSPGSRTIAGHAVVSWCLSRWRLFGPPSWGTPCPSRCTGANLSRIDSKKKNLLGLIVVCTKAGSGGHLPSRGRRSCFFN
jgi:hypothetical protein